MDVPEVRALTGDDMPAWQAIRLRMLTEHPHAFGSSAEDFSRQSLDQVRERFSKLTAQGGFQLGAFLEERLIGTIGLFREEGPRERHKATIWGVYVAPEARGHQLGRLLLTEAITRALALPGLEQLRLWVATENAPALHSYEAAGFRIIGTEPEALKFPDRYVAEHQMQLFLRDVTPHDA